MSLTWMTDSVARKPLLVGEMNPYSSDPRRALYPLPRGATGDRLREILELSDAEYLRLFDRADLFHKGERWKVADARARAADLAAGRDDLVLLGTRVCHAFNVPFVPFTVHRLVRPMNTSDDLARVRILPHPSGRNRMWDDPTAAKRARAT